MAIASGNDSSAQLPAGWTSHRTKEGRPYWYHSASKVSTWKKPEVPKCEEPPKVSMTGTPGFDNDGSFMEKIRLIMQNSQPQVAGDTKVDPAASSATTPAVASTSAVTPESLHANSSSARPAEDTSKKRKETAAVTSEERSDGRVVASAKSSRLTKAAPSKPSDAAAEYLRQVQALQSIDKSTDSTGGKWLVR